MVIRSWRLDELLYLVQAAAIAEHKVDGALDVAVLEVVAALVVI